MSLLDLRDGLISENRNEPDMLGALQQLCVIPKPSAGMEPDPVLEA